MLFGVISSPATLPVAPPSSLEFSSSDEGAIYARGNMRRPRLGVRIVTAEIARIPQIPGRFIGRLFCADIWSTAKQDPSASSAVSVSRFIAGSRGRGRSSERSHTVGPRASAVASAASRSTGAPKIDSRENARVISRI